MKRILFGALLSCIMLFIIAETSSAQGISSMRRATNQVLREGIAYPMPETACVFFDDFFGFQITNYGDSTVIPDAGWALTAVGTSPVSVWNHKYGVLRMITGGTENNGVQIQWDAEIFKANKDSSQLDFETYLKVSELAQQDFIAGLWITDTTILDSALPTDGIGIYSLDGDSLIVGVVRKNSSSVLDTLSTVVADNTWIRLGFSVQWPYVKYFVNGKQEGITAIADSAKIPDDEELAPSVAFETGAAAAESLYVDYIYVRQER